MSNGYCEKCFGNGKDYEMYYYYDGEGVQRIGHREIRCSRCGGSGWSRD